MNKIEIVNTLEFVADIEGKKDCLMAQQGELWFNIDIPKGSGFKPGDKIKVTIEKVNE